MVVRRVRARVLAVADPYQEARELDQGLVSAVQKDRAELQAVVQSVFP